MNPTAIYSKSGKGVQEASGKTSHLKRPDRAVLSAIDGRATLAEVAEKVGRSFDPAFEALITQLDKDGFVREVSPGATAKVPAASPKPKPPAPSGDGGDLDFSAIIPAASRPAPPPPPPKPSGPSPAELKAKADAERRAKEQNEALAKARQEAEARAQADRERMRKEAEEKIRAETEARMRAEAEAKMKADADAKAKVIRAAAEAKIKAEAEAKKAREEAERARKEADEKAERARKEAEEKARREQEEMRRQLEAERKAREEAEKKAKEEAERARKEAEEKAKREQEEMRRQLEEERKRMEAERKAREEEDRKRREQEEQERAARRKKEEEEEQARTKKREEEEARYRKEEEERERARRQSEATVMATPVVPPPPPPPAQQPGSATGGFADSLLADLDSFGQREEEERKAKEEAERKAREEKERKAREAEDKRRREEEERARREAEDRRRREEEERARREDEERRQREEEERARMQAEERKRMAREALAAQQASPGAPAAGAGDDDIGVSEDDLDMDDVKADEAKVSAEARKAKREREHEKAEAEAISKATVGKSRRPVKWGKPVAIGLFVLLIAAVGVIHVMPLSVGDYEAAASDALGQPVKLGSGRLSLITGPRVTFQNVSVGSVKIATVRGHPDFGSLFGAKKSFGRIELEGMTLPQEALGEAMFAKLKGDSFRVARVTATQMKLVGPLALPPLDLDATMGADAVRAVTVRGPDQLVAKITPKEAEAEFEMTTGGFAVPFAPEVKFSAFGMKGTANRQGMNIASWDGSALTGTLSGTATIRWGSTWVVDGVVTARGINAGVFAPALLSEGRGEGTGKFSMSGEPAQLAGSSRLDANFTVTKGALSVFDLSRAIQTGGRQASGRTPFAEMNGQATYDKGAVALRNVTVGAGALNAGISADIAETGALSGRIVADVKTATQTLRATFSLGGTVKEPQVRN